jgi:DNA-binding beta-propeller fold protein YncE
MSVLAVGLLLAVPLLAVAHPVRVTTSIRLTAPPSCALGNFPTGPAYNPVNNYIYVPEQSSGKITVLAPPCTVVATITLPSGANPQFAAFNPQNNYIYVTDHSLSQVYVLLGTSLVSTLTSGAFNAPSGIMFDPGDSVMFVANFGAANITAIFGTTVGGVINVGIQPTGIAYDPYFNTLLVCNYGSSNVTILSSATYPFTATHTSAVAGSPESIVFNPADNFDYVASYGTDNVTVMTGLGGVVANVPVGHGPIGVAFSQAKLEVYVTMRNSNSVWVLSGTAVVKKVALGVSVIPLGLTYDDANDKIYVAGAGTNLLYALQ